MVDFHIKRLPYNLTAHAGLSLIGQYLKRFARSIKSSSRNSDQRRRRHSYEQPYQVLYRLAVCTGKSDFDAIESLRRDDFFLSALGLAAVPSAPTLRQRMDAYAADDDKMLCAVDKANMRLRKRAKPVMTPLTTGHLALDFDVFPMDNSCTAKESVSRTYAGFVGFAPIAAYLGEEDFCLGLELREGAQHSARETPDYLARVLKYGKHHFPHKHHTSMKASQSYSESDDHDYNCCRF